MYIKTTVIDHLAPGKMVDMKKTKHSGQDVESGEFLHYVGIKRGAVMDESGEVPQKPENLLYNPAIECIRWRMDHHTKEMPTLLQFSY